MLRIILREKLKKLFTIEHMHIIFKSQIKLLAFNTGKSID
jgi:hypothetical protein